MCYVNVTGLVSTFFGTGSFYRLGSERRGFCPIKWLGMKTRLTWFIFGSCLVFAQSPIFNGRDLTGWHISEVNHHGNTKGWSVKDGAILGTQVPAGNGGILLTDRPYKNFEIALEVKPDWGCDGGLFLRSDEKGNAYQVMLDYLPGGTVGGIYGEGLGNIEANKGQGDSRAKDWEKYWRKDDWNQIRARIEGDSPHIQVWMNGHQVVDWTDWKNHLPGDATSGMIALQVHRTDPKATSGGRWIPNGLHRFRNIVVKELP